MSDNAPTFLDDANDPYQFAFDLDWIKGFSRPALLTVGHQSPPTFGPVVAMLADALPMGELVTLPGAGHIPHVIHPERYVEGVRAFVPQNGVGPY